ncbi:MAG TPA: hypothetical protein VE860_06890 [Chthoniobacterales bacterium]|jgi:hypothetical protein|nr:hypothetical protein [Chthoniobacterales bacterium]
MLFAGTVRTSAKLWQKEFRPLKSLVERMNCLMIAAGFPVFTDRFNQVLNYPSPIVDPIAGSHGIDRLGLDRFNEVRQTGRSGGTRFHELKSGRMARPLTMRSSFLKHP